MNDAQRDQLDRQAVQAQMILAQATSNGECEVWDNYILASSNLSLPTFNFFIPLTLTGLTDTTLADASAFFRTRKVPYAVSLEEHRVPDGTEYLSRRRYLPLPPQPIMALTELPTEPKYVNNFIIEPVTTVPGLTALYTLLEFVFDYPPSDVMLLFPATQLSAESIKHFVGFTDSGIPVSAATAVYTDKVVSIWNLCTTDDFRCRGYASALVSHILTEALAQGCNLSFVYATPLSFSLLNNFGYKLYAIRQWFLPQEGG